MAHSELMPDIFKEVYLAIISLAERVGIQIIFMSEDKLDNVDSIVLIDISSGLNPFHHK